MASRFIIKRELKRSTKMITIGASIIMLMASMTNVVETQGNFVAGLTGNQDVPPTNTSALGSAYFVPLLDSKLFYAINVTDIDNVTQANLNIGKQGSNGPIVVTLFGAKSPTGQINGTLSQGNITFADLQGPMTGKHVSDLVDFMQSGYVYVNISTVSNPRGEIRGQIGFAGIDESGTTAGEQVLPPSIQEVD